MLEVAILLNEGFIGSSRSNIRQLNRLYWIQVLSSQGSTRPPVTLVTVHLDQGPPVGVEEERLKGGEDGNALVEELEKLETLARWSLDSLQIQILYLSKKWYL